LQKSLLGHFLGVLRISQDPQRYPKDADLMAADQLLEGMSATRARQPDQG